MTETTRARLLLGTDPLALRQLNVESERQALADAKARAHAEATPETVARHYHARISSQFRNEKHRAQWLASLENHVFEELGRRPIESIKAEELLELLLPLRDSVPETVDPPAP